MKAMIDDDRTPDQKKTHRWAVIGTDLFRSSWGEAESRVSYTGWAFKNNQRCQVERWVRNRNDQKRVRVVYLPDYRPSRKDVHLHIYVVGPNHRALQCGYNPPTS